MKQALTNEQRKKTVYAISGRKLDAILKDADIESMTVFANLHSQNAFIKGCRYVKSKIENEYGKVCKDKKSTNALERKRQADID